MVNIDPFTWWAMCISGGIIFLILVSIYLYASSRTKQRAGSATETGEHGGAGSFVFVFILVGLLIFYIVAVDIGSAPLFAAGNIVVEVMLIAYLVRNRQRRP
jgi:Flp pilus assembly protein TadB